METAVLLLDDQISRLCSIFCEQQFIISFLQVKLNFVLSVLVIDDLTPSSTINALHESSNRAVTVIASTVSIANDAIDRHSPSWTEVVKKQSKLRPHSLITSF